MVAKNLREDDKNELIGAGEAPINIPFYIVFSEHPTVFFSPQGEYAGVAGVIRENNDIGKVWMLCTPAIKSMPHTFVRHSMRWLKRIQPEYRLLWNLTDARNHVHHKLLKHLGFKSLRTVPFGPDNLPYYEIVKLCAQ